MVQIPYSKINFKVQHSLKFVNESTTSPHGLYKQSYWVFYKNAFLKFLENSQQNSCARVFFSFNINEKRL